MILREILGLALIVVGLTSVIAHLIAAGRRAAAAPSARGPGRHPASEIARD